MSAPDDKGKYKEVPSEDIEPAEEEQTEGTGGWHAEMYHKPGDEEDKEEPGEEEEPKTLRERINRRPPTSPFMPMHIPHHHKVKVPWLLFVDLFLPYCAMGMIHPGYAFLAGFNIAVYLLFMFLMIIFSFSDQSAWMFFALFAIVWLCESTGAVSMSKEYPTARGIGRAIRAALISLVLFVVLSLVAEYYLIQELNKIGF